MIIKNYRVIEATDDELLRHYLTKDRNVAYNYKTYKEICIARGTKIIEESEKHK